MPGEIAEIETSIVADPERELKNSMLFKAGLAVTLGGLLTGSGRAILVGTLMMDAAFLWSTRPDRVY